MASSQCETFFHAPQMIEPVHEIGRFQQSVPNMQNITYFFAKFRFTLLIYAFST